VEDETLLEVGDAHFVSAALSRSSSRLSRPSALVLQ
jgi:hypothetical protein